MESIGVRLCEAWRVPRRWPRGEDGVSPTSNPSKGPKRQQAYELTHCAGEIRLARRAALDIERRVPVVEFGDLAGRETELTGTRTTEQSL